MNKVFLWVALAALPLLGHAAAIDKYSKRSYINGQIRPGDFEKADKAFAQGFSPLLVVKVAADSAAFETMRIGLLVHEHKPALSIERDCVGPCAMFLLTSGSSARIAKDTLIAFSTHSEWDMVLRERVRNGELFIDQEPSQLSRARLLERLKLRADASTLMRDTANQLVPAPALQFLRALTSPDRLENVSFTEDQYSFKMHMAPGSCPWWVPDAQGLQQLGVQAAAYTPVDRAWAAKQLKVDARLVYIGPAVDPIPAGGLCPEP